MELVIYRYESFKFYNRTFHEIKKNVEHDFWMQLYNNFDRFMFTQIVSNVHDTTKVG